MQKLSIVEKPLLLGESRQLFGILTTPGERHARSGVLILNAGLLHCPGPFRLHVNLAHEFSRRHIATIRIDQSGKGESPSRPGLTHSESVLADFDEVQIEFERLGVQEISILGLCSGADDATYIAANRQNIGSLVLLDGYARRNIRYYLNHVLPRLASPAWWKRHGSRMGKKLVERFRAESNSAQTDLSIEIRDWPSRAEMIRRYRSILSNGTRILSIFTAGQEYYNYRGQLSDSLGYAESPSLLHEVYIPTSDHVYSAWDSRQQLVSLVSDWLEKNTPDVAAISGPERHDEHSPDIGSRAV